LLARLVHREDQAAVQKLLVDVTAVVVRKIITGPSTRYSCVTIRPVCGSLPVEAIDSSPSDWSSFKA